MSGDAYSIARYVSHYTGKNGYAPTISVLPCNVEYAEKLRANGILEFFSLTEGGPAAHVRLTDKGFRMATEGPRLARRR